MNDPGLFDDEGRQIISDYITPSDDEIFNSDIDEVRFLGVDRDQGWLNLFVFGSPKTIRDVSFKDNFTFDPVYRTHKPDESRQIEVRRRVDYVLLKDDDRIQAGDQYKYAEDGKIWLLFGTANYGHTCLDACFFPETEKYKSNSGKRFVFARRPLKALTKGEPESTDEIPWYEQFAK